MSGELAAPVAPLRRAAHGLRSPLWPAALLALAAVIVWIAPAERTLGGAMRVVYVHVALTWAGMLGLAVAALLGLVVMVSGRRSWAAWLQAVTSVALGLLLLGTATSAIAAYLTWGGGFADEPRAQTALRILAVAIIIVVGGGWLPWVRLRGALAAGLLAYSAFALRATPLLLHPRNPIATSPSSAIQATFAGLFVIFALLGVWAAWRLQARSAPAVRRHYETQG
jgi:hypothetical protein